jgi:hypothetical protein
MAESAINSIMMVSRTIMVESELGAWFLFNSAVAGSDARNVIDKERIGTTLGGLCIVKKWCIRVLISHVDARHGFISRFSTQKEEIRVVIIRHKLLNSVIPSILHSNLKRAYSFFFQKKCSDIIQSSTIKCDSASVLEEEDCWKDSLQSYNWCSVSHFVEFQVVVLQIYHVHTSNSKLNLKSNPWRRGLDSPKQSLNMIEEQQAHLAGILHQKPNGLLPSIDADCLPKDSEDAVTKSRHASMGWGIQYGG